VKSGGDSGAAMNLLAAWKKVLLFGLFGAIGCMAGWLVGEPYIYAAQAAIKTMGADEVPSLITTPAAPTPPPPPREFLDRLNAAGAKTGDVQISLIWFNANDLDLHCIDPSDFEIYWDRGHRRSPTRGELDVDRNAGCKPPLDDKPVENIYWPRGEAPLGDYRVYLNYFQHCPSAPDETEWKINILHGGKRHDFNGTIRKADTPDGGPKKLVYSFRLEPSIELLAPSEVEIRSGQTRKIPFVVRREFYSGDIEVKAENLPPNVTAEPLTLAGNAAEGELVLKASAGSSKEKIKIKIAAAGKGVADSAVLELLIPAPSFSLAAIVSTGVWTALLAVGLSLALAAGQNRYLGKSLFAPGSVPLAMVVLGAALAGFVADGDTRAVGNVTVVVRFGSGTPTASTAAAPVSAPVIPALPPPPAPAATAPAKATHAEYDDGLPMPLGPPPPPRPAAASILDLDDYRAAPRNPVVGPAAAAPAPPRPAAPVAAKPVPPAPKPAAPAGKATDPDGCPSCGRKSPGQPGARYCMVCDRTF
jgi:hypothetical protein